MDYLAYIYIQDAFVDLSCRFLLPKLFVYHILLLFRKSRFNILSNLPLFRDYQ